MKISLIAFVIFFTLVGQVVCDDPNGNKLLSDCKPVTMGGSIAKDNYKVIVDGGFCLGYITGVNSTSEAILTHFKFPLLYCLPKGIDNIQLVRVIVKYLENHPEELPNKSTLLVLAALKEAFPCEEKP